MRACERASDARIFHWPREDGESGGSGGGGGGGIGSDGEAASARPGKEERREGEGRAFPAWRAWLWGGREGGLRWCGCLWKCRKGRKDDLNAVCNGRTARVKCGEG